MRAPRLDIRRAAPRSLLLSSVLMLCALPTPGAAQIVDMCADGRISEIFIDNHSVFDLTDPGLSDRLAWAYRTANKLHSRTRESVIERELLFAVGDCYEPERLRDSERLLRGLRSIADVDIFGITQADGSVHVVVDTQDEWSTRVEPEIANGGLAGVALREDNFFGTGQQVGIFYRDDREEQIYGALYDNPQLFGTRTDLTLHAGRTPVGYLISEAVAYPFVGEEGRWAFVQAARRDDRYFEYFLPNDTGLLAAWYPERRHGFEAGLARRWGRPGAGQTVLGFVVAGEWIGYPEGARFASREMDEAGEVPPPLLRDSVASVRAIVTAGQRRIRYVRRHALDTVNGTEDVRLGIEADVSFGPSIPGVSRDRNLALSFGVSAAAEPGAGLLSGLEMSLQALREYDATIEQSEWGDVIGEAVGWAYYRPHERSSHTTHLFIAAAGAWNDRTPFQLTLGSRTGLRGHDDHQFAGGRRVVATLEHRTYLGWPLPDLFDLGAVVFADAGRIWAGDVPFGATSPLRVAAGAGLRFAFPPGSRQTLRLDFGFPIADGASWRDGTISIGMGQAVGRHPRRADREVARTVRLRPARLFETRDHPE